ncbi:MAG: U32 family peptidase, partial [Treponema sp.]
LYTFNRWAVSWLENQNIEAFIMPYENSKKNLEATFDMQVRQRVIVPVFAYPALFRIRFKLPENYGFTYMSDKENEEFKIVSSADGSFVMPEMPFSLLDKTDRLSQAGFKRILIDFSRIKISKNQVKSVTASIIKKQPLADISRFNWKDGFYSARQIEEFKAGNERAKARRLSQKQNTAAQSNGRNKKLHRSGKRK